MPLLHFSLLSLKAKWFYAQVALVVQNLPANAGDIGDMGLIPGLGRYPRGRNGNPLQYSCLENPMGRGVWSCKESDPAYRLSTVSYMAKIDVTKIFSSKMSVEKKLMVKTLRTGALAS